MKNFMLLLLAVLLLSSYGYSNVGMPGIFNASGSGMFSCAYPEDSLYLKKIQMVKEQITIQIYYDSIDALSKRNINELQFQNQK